MKVATAIVLDTRYTSAKNSKTFPVKLRVTYKRKQKYYAVQKFANKESDFMLQLFSLSESDFQKSMKQLKPRGIHYERARGFQAIEQRAREIIDSLPKFSFNDFEKHFHSTGRNVDDVFNAYQHYISQLTTAGAIGTASSYECSLASIKKVMGKTRLSFSDITVEFLKSYHDKMIKAGNSETTIGIYMRCLRTLYNIAIETGLVKQESYPFGRRRYEIPRGIAKEKKALKMSDLQKLFEYKTFEGTVDQWALDMWRFSYLCNGINLKDIAHLTFNNISSERIIFTRAKTKGRSNKQVVAIITPEVQEIIDRWSSKQKSSENYVFEILTSDSSPEQQFRKVQQAIKTINKYVKRIATEVGIEKHVTTYTARHSFATVLKLSNAPLPFISESLGHHSQKTTESYLDNFEDETKRLYANRLTDFSQQSH